MAGVIGLGLQQNVSGAKYEAMRPIQRGLVPLLRMCDLNFGIEYLCGNILSSITYIYLLKEKVFLKDCLIILSFFDRGRYHFLIGEIPPIIF